jgi:hypothetical protein
MRSQSATPSYTCATATALALEAAFDGGRLTSDGGLPWLAEAEAATGICAALAVCVPEWRRGHVQHSLAALVRQRVFPIACGYEDQNDADSLRGDPLLKLVCGRLPESDPELASQPTFSRLENAVDRRACRHLAHALLAVYLQQREQDGPPAHILLDIDSTDDPTHGQQEGTAYHGYYGQHLYHPCFFSTGTPSSGSRRCCGRAMRTPVVASSVRCASWCAQCGPAGLESASRSGLIVAVRFLPSTASASGSRSSLPSG